MESERERHHHTPEEERRIREAALDETIAYSFPASDPPSSNPTPTTVQLSGVSVPVMPA